MKRAAAVLTGKHDFAAFMASGCGAAHAVRTITSITIAEIAQRGEVSIDITGDGFVRHMVRNMVGLMVEAGQGKRSTDDVKRILEGAERSEAGVCAPASGLYLVSIEY
jgi:tRNA pseudouridine38-40 synthase